MVPFRSSDAGELAEDRGLDSRQTRKRPSLIITLVLIPSILGHVACFITGVHGWAIQLVNEPLHVPNAAKLWLQFYPRSFSAQPSGSHHGPEFACSLQAEPGHRPTGDPQGAGSCEGRALRNVSVPFPISRYQGH